MNLPFTNEEFLGVFERYNTAIWPAQAFLSILALAIVFLALRRYSFSDIVISVLLGLTWLWMGGVYHLVFFSQINPAAYIFGSLCILQGVLFLWVGFKVKPSYQVSFGWKESIGALFVIYALLLYPACGMMFGHLFPKAPSFGAPCPTTIFTFGVLLWTSKLPKYMLIIPALWSVVGFTAALNLGIYEDIGLLVAGIAGTIILLTGKVKTPAA